MMKEFKSHEFQDVGKPGLPHWYDRVAQEKARLLAQRAQAASPIGKPKWRKARSPKPSPLREISTSDVASDNASETPGLKPSAERVPDGTPRVPERNAREKGEDPRGKPKKRKARSPKPSVQEEISGSDGVSDTANETPGGDGRSTAAVGEASGSEKSKAEDEEVVVVGVEKPMKHLLKKRNKIFLTEVDEIINRAKSKCGVKRRRKNSDGLTLPDNIHEVIGALIADMREAAREDQRLSTPAARARRGDQAADWPLRKMRMLNRVRSTLRRPDMKRIFVEQGGVPAVSDWLTPMQDGSLPPLEVREHLLRILQDLPDVTVELLKTTGIGRAVRQLAEHPSESHKNKAAAKRLVADWRMLVGNIRTNYRGMTAQERQALRDERREKAEGADWDRDLQRELQRAEKRRADSLSPTEDGDASASGDAGIDPPEKRRRVEEECLRAARQQRVQQPMPSTKVYWIAPEPTFRPSPEPEASASKKKPSCFAWLNRITYRQRAARRLYPTSRRAWERLG